MNEALMWVHEDEEGLRCLYPAAAFAHLSEDVRASAEAAERNRAPGGEGYTDMYAVEPPQQDFEQLGLRRADVIAALDGLMPRWRNFQLGDGKYFGYVDKDAVCYGFDNQCVLYAAPRGDLIHSFWFTAWTDDAGQLAALRAAVEAIDRLQPSALVDYWVDMSGIVSDAGFLDKYFTALADATSDLSGIDLIRTNSRRDPP